MSTWVDAANSSDQAILNNKIAGLSLTNTFGPEDFTPRIEQAQRYMTGKISQRFGAAIVLAWTRLTVPTRLKDLCATLAIIYLKQDYVQDYQFTGLDKLAFTEINDIASGAIELVDATAAVAATDDNVLVSTHDHHKKFTHHSLHGFGVDGERHS